jgi:hypothetical protein
MQDKEEYEDFDNCRDLSVLIHEVMNLCDCVEPRGVFYTGRRGKVERKDWKSVIHACRGFRNI